MTRMLKRAVLLLPIPLCVAASGCVSKSTAEAHARAAYLAGQRDAISQMTQRQSGTDGSEAIPNVPTNVSFIGPVQHPVVPWVQGLTLAQAIVTATYDSPVDPVMIIVRRDREEIQISPQRLLSGGDYPLQPGDIIHIQLPTQ